MGEYGCPALALELRREAVVSLLRVDDARTDAALFAVENGVSLARRGGVLVWARHRVFERPRGGEPVTLYATATIVDGVVIRTIDGLRSHLGDDASFDRFVEGHPEARAWAESWYAWKSPA